jgi:1-acyl-sn-glycerol-3-phosphate acyltransferase
MLSLLLKIYDYFVWCAAVSVFAVTFFIWSSVAMILRPILSLDHGRKVGRTVITRGFRAFLGLVSVTGRVHFDLSELDKIRGEKSLIVACNHPSLMDALLIISRLPNLCCIMKHQLNSNLFFGGGARLAGYVENKTATKMLKGAIAELHSGSGLLIFPEGTRSAGSSVSPFKRSVGSIATHAKVSVQTVFIETNSSFLTKKVSLTKRPLLPITYRVRLGRRFDPPKNSIAFIAELERYFKYELGRVSTGNS